MLKCKQFNAVLCCGLFNWTSVHCTCSVDTPYKAVCAWILTVFGSEDSTAGFPLDCILIGFEMLFLKGSECESREEAIEANAQEDIGKL